jgi:hypothetical protein
VVSEVSRQLIRFLFPRWCRIAGFLFTISGILIACLVYILDFKPKFLDIKVFSVFSYYFDKRYFSVISNNIGEEIIMILILTGLFLLSFSKLRNESEVTVLLRLKALFISLYINTFILILSVVFIYGLGFIAITVANCFSLLFINAIVLQVLIFRQNNQKRTYGSL